LKITLPRPRVNRHGIDYNAIQIEDQRQTRFKRKPAVFRKAHLAES
jgi:hypothetical protein